MHRVNNGRIDLRLIRITYKLSPFGAFWVFVSCLLVCFFGYKSKEIYILIKDLNNNGTANTLIDTIQKVY